MLKYEKNIPKKLERPGMGGGYFGLYKAKFASPYWGEIEVVVVFPLV